ncbi:MAG: hypothetical protein ABF379_14610 [Akkermansiaceae bacterium]
MKAILLFLVAQGSLAAQITVPDKGWRKVENGAGQIEGMKRLGIWERVDRADGSVMVAAAWADEMPPLSKFLDLPAAGIPRSGSILKAGMVEKPAIGLMVEFKGKKYLHHEGMRHYWFCGKKGGVFLQVFYDRGAKYSFDDWKIEGAVEDGDGRQRNELDGVLKNIEVAQVEPLIRINPKLTPSIDDRISKVNGLDFTVVLRKSGTIEFNGMEIDFEVLGKEMKKAVQGTEEKIVLKVEPEKDVEFKYVQRVIKVAAASGIKLVAYASFAADNQDEEE